MSTAPEALGEWNEVVAAALADLNAVPELDGFRPNGEARVSPCSASDGDTFPISAGRSWDVIDTTGGDHVTESQAKAFVRLMEFMGARGWSVRSRHVYTQSLTPVNPDFDAVDLVRRRDRRGVSVMMQLLPGGILVQVGFAGAPAGCAGVSD